MFLHFFGIVFMGENPRQSAEQIEGLWVIHGAECEVCFCHANAQCFYLRSSLGREKTLKFVLLWSDWSPRRLWAEWWVQTFFWFYSSLQCGLSLTLPFSCSLINYYAYNKLYFYIIITTQYLVKWLNYSAFENSWEREENLLIDLVRSVLFMFSKYFK